VSPTVPVVTVSAGSSDMQTHHVMSQAPGVNTHTYVASRALKQLIFLIALIAAINFFKLCVSRILMHIVNYRDSLLWAV